MPNSQTSTVTTKSESAQAVGDIRGGEEDGSSKKTYCFTIVTEFSLAYLANALARMRISKRSAEVLVQALNLIAVDQSLAPPNDSLTVVADQDHISDSLSAVSSSFTDPDHSCFDSPDLDQRHTPHVTAAVTFNLFATAPISFGHAVLTGPPGPSVLIPPSPPPAPQRWHKCYRGYVYNFPSPNELNNDRFYCVTKGVRVGVFADWQITSDLTQGIRRSAQSKSSSLQKCISKFETALDCGAVEILEDPSVGTSETRL
ncbi:hypothetical protein EV363DRAFT_1400245 [Boletus edulis]|nr:hypothetical protein EV363DRAFT_1400245 [Boletus edulis]